MSDIDRLIESPQFQNISKRERLQISRERAKLEKNLGSISDLSRLPAAVFIVDIMKEHIALAEARKLAIPTFAIVDTNSDPRLVDYPIPANDDASKSIAVVLKAICDAIREGQAEREMNKDRMEEEMAEMNAENEGEERENDDREGGRRRRVSRKNNE